MIKKYGWRYFQDRKTYKDFVANGTVTEVKSNPYHILYGFALFIAILTLLRIMAVYQQYGIL